MNYINQWLHMALMSRATYLWYSMHMKTMSLLAMFVSLIVILQTKKNAMLQDRMQSAAGLEADVDPDGGDLASVAKQVLDPIIMAIALQKILDLGDLMTMVLNEYRDLEYRVLVM